MNRINFMRYVGVVLAIFVSVSCLNYERKASPILGFFSLGTSSGSPSIFTVGGSVTGLSGTGLIIQNNGDDSLPISANGGFTFATSVASGTSYSVTISKNPTSPAQVCTVANGTGKIPGNNVTNISIVCSTNSFTVGGSVSGLTGTGLTLQNNGTDDLAISANGTFTFASPVASGATFSVTVSVNPTAQSCSVSGGSGTVTTSNITTVSISCGAPTFSIGGNITNLTGTIVLQNNGGDTTSISANGSYSMTTQMADLSAYSVSIQTQPAGQTCYIVSNSGAVATANVSSIDISCVSVSLPGPLIGGQVVVSNLLPTPISENPAVGPANASDYAGSRNNPSLTDNSGTLAGFNGPIHITTDGVNLYVADGANHSIRKIVIATRQVTTLVTVAGLSPRGITTDGIYVYFTGLDNSIRKYNLTTGVLTTIVGAGFSAPRDITTDGSNLYVADTNNHLIKKINILTSAVTTLAGTGVAGSTDDPAGAGGIATFNAPRGIMYSANTLYVANSAGNNIRKIDLSTSPVKVTTIAGDPAQSFGSADNTTGISATFKNPVGITRDANNLFVIDELNGLIRKISLSPPHRVDLYLGCQAGAIQSGGFSSDLVCNAGEAQFHSPFGITTDGTSFFVTEQGAHFIRKID